MTINGKIEDIIIKDMRILRGVEKQTGLKFDRTYKYCTDYKNSNVDDLDLFVHGFEYKGTIYTLRFYDGCFCPYLTTIKITIM